MTEHLWQIISGVLFFSNGLPWFMMYRSERKRKNAEADKATAEADQLRIDLQQDQFDFMSERVNKCIRENLQMQDELNKRTSEFLNETVELRQKLGNTFEEISELKRKIEFYRGHRCYREDCRDRVMEYITNQ